ncbi:hypothetical protein FRC19_004054 [Serendipita sp. 401]|nr:hypothetical protein FRC19_004054 [Serendipita sp. 401]KAG9052693.1 hypothetical protein FS842_009395 [Serendipita sp. 407]
MRISNTTNRVAPGTIQLEIRRAVKVGKSSSPVEPPQQKKVGDIPETVKHLGGQKIELGRILHKSKGNAKGFTIMHLDSSPYLTFKFFYRPLELLQALGLAPQQESYQKPVFKRSDSIPSSHLDSEGETEDEIRVKINAVKRKREKLREERRSKRVRVEQLMLQSGVKYEDSVVIKPEGTGAEGWSKESAILIDSDESR